MKTPTLSPVVPLLAVLLLASASGGCSDLGPEDELLQHVENARTRWNAARPQRYTYSLRRTCECTPDMAGPVSVTVQGTEAVAWHYPDGRDVAAELHAHFPSVDGLLAMIEEAVREGAWDVNVQYDGATGVPVYVGIDYEQFVFDEEAIYNVVEMPRASEG